MALVQSVLSSGFQGMLPAPAESAAIAAFVAAWDGYFAGASVNAIPATPGSFAAGSAAMQGALVGMSAPGAAAAAMQSGITAFWSAIAPLATAIWITAPIVLIPPIVPPVGIGGIAAALTGVFASNTASSASIVQAADAMAAAIHPAGGIGALVPGSVPPTPPAPLPIL